MRIRSMNCSGCGAPLQVDTQVGYGKCPYCDSMNYLDDGTVRYVDEARVKEADLQILRLQEERREQDNTQEQTNKWKRARTIWLIALGVLFVLIGVGQSSFASGLFLAVLIFGGIFVRSLRPNNLPRQNTSSAGPARYTQTASRSTPADSPWQNYQTYRDPAVSPKDRVVALLLCFFLGLWGAHHFYVGRVGKGILYIFTFGIFGIGILVDLIKLAVGSFKAAQGRVLK